MKKKFYLPLLCLLLILAAALPAEAAVNAVPSSVKVKVGQKKVAVRAYNIDGANYFKLRDVAMALKNSPKSFNVSWNNTTKSIALTKGQKYRPVGGELSADLPVITSIAPSEAGLILDEVPVELTAYTINGNNYFKLRDLCALLEIGVTYSAEQNQIQLRTDMDYVRSAFLELADKEPNEYQFVKVHNSKYLYSVELPAILAGLPLNHAGDGLTVYDDSDKDHTSYSNLSVFAGYNVLDQTLEEAAQGLLSYIPNIDKELLSITPISVKGAQAAYKLNYVGEYYIQAVIAKKNDAFYYLTYHCGNFNLIDSRFLPVLSDLYSRMEESLTIY